MENSQKRGGAKDLNQAYRTAYLIAGFLKNELNGEERDELDEWILEREENMILFEKMTDERNIAEAREWFRKMKIEEDLIKTKRKIAARKPTRIWAYIAAAAVLILIIGGIYIIQPAKNDNEKPSVVQTHDIAPGSNVATLTLDNGAVVELGIDGVDTAITSKIKVLRKEGQLVYDPGDADKTTYHTLVVPRRGQYKVILSDGTKVWLNSESSIRYPASFNGNERRVFATGETYFEVAKGEKPFRVVSGDITVEALGTQFTVNAYSNEPFVSATLVEGSIMVSKASEENILKPGQQARLTANEFSIAKVNVDSATSWKNNQFKFINTPIDAVMRQIERWYDAEVEYQQKLTLHLNATIERDVPVSELLHIFEQTEQVKFKVEGKKIIVMK